MFQPVDSKVNFSKMEERIQKFWEENEIYRKSVDNRSSDNEYVFYDGPPFATGLPHFGHLVPGTIKDLYPRYQTMKGKRVNRRFGWDCHGVPVEQEMGKILNISGHKAVQEYGVAKYNEQCRSIVLRYTSEWKATINRMGRWVDFENGYRTMDTSYMETIWWIFSTLYKKGLIYEGYNILPYSPALATPLSNFEVNLGGYQDVSDPAVTVRFKLDDMDNTYMLAWTTTPWTLPSNLALALGPDIDYVMVLDKQGGQRYILGEKRLSHYYKDPSDYEVLKHYKGRELADLRYEPLFPFFSHLKETGAFVTVLGDYVTVEDGCGIVHTAPGFGEDDYQVLKGTGIPVVCPIDDDCNFTEEVSLWKGVFVKDADKSIIEWLKANGKLVKKETIVHSYPFCYRTHKPLIYRAMACWYVDVTQLKDSMLRANEQITWIPDHLKYGRFGKWLEGARDWAISRNRFWGNPIPVWKCDGSEYLEVIGSIDELEQHSGVRVTDLHKHFVDDITWPSPDGKGTMRRVADVLDCWFESGSMPYAQNHYPFENKEFVEAHFPGDFICEGLDQTRGWFYTLVILGAALFDKPAFYHCVTNGIVLTADGKKMSKSLKNYSDPMDIVNTYGADALRFALMNSAVTRAEDLKFSEDSVKEVLKTLIIPLWNAYSFFVTYANIDGWNPENHQESESDNAMDRWILSASEALVQEVTDAWDRYDTQRGCQAIVNFIDSLNNWYIRRSRRRFWRSENDLDKSFAYRTLYCVLMKLIHIAAPVIPFTTEELYQNLKTSTMSESIHLEDFPMYNEALRDGELERIMGLAQKAITVGRALRAVHNLKIRQPLKKVVLVSRDEAERAILAEMEAIIAEELNVKSVVVRPGETELVTYSAKANFKVLGSKLGKHMKAVASNIQNLDSYTIETILDGGTVDIEYEDGVITIDAGDIVVQRTERAHMKVMNDGTLTVGFDTEITNELLLEGIARDIIRSVQNLRKESGFDVADRISLSIDGEQIIRDTVEMFGPYISSETLSDTLEFGKTDSMVIIPCGDLEVSVAVRRV
ncbi:MAG: isoleucine--tRNA ligase [Spirochaetales bacterium]|nr:isoleucine--tRNA ligase [Spirochaetales bacterium]